MLYLIIYLTIVVLYLIFDIINFKYTTMYKDPTIETYCRCNKINIGIILIPAVNVVYLLLILLELIWNKIKDIKL